MGVRSTNSTQSFFDDFFRSGTDAVTPFVSPFIASGGVISDYTVSGTKYRAHIFTSSGSLVVASGSANVDCLVVAGGGGGGLIGGGGGAGGAVDTLNGEHCPSKGGGGGGGGGAVTLVLDSAIIVFLRSSYSTYCKFK